jgi:hypothetical protein
MEYVRFCGSLLEAALSIFKDYYSVKFFFAKELIKAN